MLYLLPVLLQVQISFFYLILQIQLKTSKFFYFIVFFNDPIDRSGAITHYDGTAWTQVHFGGGHLYAVAGTNDGYVYAAGAGGLLLRNNGGDEWEPMESPTSNVLLGAASPTGNELLVVGNSGNILELH